MALPFLTLIFTALVWSNAPSELNALLQKTPPIEAKEAFQALSSKREDFQNRSSPDFFFNLGVAALSAGRPELSRLSILKSLRATPWDGQTRIALRQAEGRTAASILLVKPAHWWIDSLWFILIPWFIVGPFGLFATGCFLLLRLRGKKISSGGALGVGAVGGVLVVLTLSLALQQRKEIAGVWEASSLRAGPGEEYPELGQAQAGWLLSQEEAQGEWVRIRFSQPGRGETVGWITKSRLLPL
jgi:hypothetical protein